MPATAVPPHHMVLLFSDIVGSVALKTHFGTETYARLISRHDELFRNVLSAIPGAEIVKDTGDGFLARFVSARDAVNSALQFQSALQDEPWEPEPLRVRIGVHVGEVMELGKDVDGRPKLVGLAADIAARLLDLALPGQVLLTRAAFDDARQYVREHPTTRSDRGQRLALKWMAHGAYRFQGAEQATEVFEVGAAGLAPLEAPPDGAKARRVVATEEEELLGWRPAAGLEVPHRRGWKLERRLGVGGFGEVWRARHEHTRDARSFKFCFQPDRLRTLKRELTLFRLMKEVLGERSDIARLYEVQLDEPPYFLEMEYTAGGDLARWAETRGGIARLPLPTRLALVAQVADALAAAHSVGVLHKDVKPSNVLIHEGADEHVQARLTDFGIGQLVSREALVRAGVTATGFTETVAMSDLGSQTGTRLYMAPELAAGKAPSIQSDIYALGVLLYQLVVGDLTRPLATGWERDVEDRHLHEDIAACVDVDTARRLSGAGELAKRLRGLKQRRLEWQQQEAARRAAQRREKITRVAVASAVVLAVLLSLVGYNLYREHALRLTAARARERAMAEAAKAEAVNEFLRNMLASVEPERAKRPEITVEYILDQAANRIADGALDGQPEIEATVRTTIGNGYRALGRHEAAETHLRAALDIREKLFGQQHTDVAESLYYLAWVLDDRGDYASAERLYRRALEQQRKLLGDEHRAVADTLNNLALVLESRGDHAEAESLCRQALALYRQLLGDEHVDIADGLNNLGCVLQARGDYAAAEQLYRDALTIYQKLVGDEHPHIAQVWDNLATVLQERGDLAGAEPLYRRALVMRRKLFGAEHPDVAESLNDLATLLHDRGDHAGAEALYREALEVYRQVLGDDHPRTATTMNNLAVALQAAGDYAEAETLYRQAVVTFRKAYGEEHSEVANALSNLAVLLDDTGNDDAAATLYREALEIRRSVHGNAHQEVVTLLQSLAGALNDRGDHAAAESCYQEALELSRKVSGDEHPNTLAALHDLAMLYYAHGRCAEAEPLFAQVLEARRQVLGPDDADTLLTLWGLVAARNALGRYAEAEPLALECYERNKIVYGEAHGETRDAGDLLIALYEGWDRPEQAAAWRARLVTPEAAATQNAQE